MVTDYYLTEMFQLTISVESRMLADYLRYIFPPEEGSELCRVSATRAVGSLLIAFAKPAVMPVPVEGKHLVKLDIPWYRNATSDLENHWLYLDKGGTAKINLALKAEFEIEFAGYYRKGESLGMRKMDIIDAFIFSRNLATENYDALHKRVYRSQQRAQEQLRQKLLRRAYYLNESIDYTGLSL